LRFVTKVMWTKGQYTNTLRGGGKAVLGEGCRASCDELAGRLIFGAIFFHARAAQKARFSPAHTFGNTPYTPSACLTHAARKWYPQ